MALTCFIVNVIRQIRVKTVIMMALPMGEDLAPEDPCTADGTIDGDEPEGWIAQASNDCDLDQITVEDGDQDDFDECTDQSGLVNSLACNCPGEINSTAGVYISDIGISNGSDADGLPDDDFTNTISNRDVLTLGYDLGEEFVFGEICVVVSFNNSRGSVTITHNNLSIEVDNPTGDNTRAPQTICVPIEGQGEQEVEFRDSGNGIIRIDGSEVFYCVPESEGSIVPDFNEPQIGKTGDILSLIHISEPTRPY